MSRAGRSIKGGENQVWVGVGQGSLFWGVPSKDEEAEGDGTAVPGAQLPSGCLIKPRTASRVTLGCKSH